MTKNNINIKNLMQLCIDKIKKFNFNINIINFILIYSFFITAIFNINFFKKVYEVNNKYSILIIAFLVVLCVYNILFTLLFQRRLTKIFSIFFLLSSAGILYFMNTYKVAIDRVMLLNVRETNLNETLELLNLVWFNYILFLGIIPSIIILKTKINYFTIKKEILFRCILIFISLLIGFGTILFTYKTTSSFARQNKRLKHILIPFNYFDATFSLSKDFIKQKQYKFEDITSDVVYKNTSKNGKRNLVIFVVGEASRAKNWSLLGYDKDTNKYLENQDLIYFNNVFSCGTSTAISVPCMFSHLSKNDFDIDRRDAYSNLLDFLKKADFNVLWRENNSDCKGVCNRVLEEDFTKNKENKKYCNNKECFDEILVQDLQEKINNVDSRNTFIVLHQKGSHGPAYYLRYPEEFEKYKPTCNSEYFSECTDEEIANTYDNTLNYTSFVLNEAINILKNNQEKFNVALIYISDHGQSLGENGIYLHGAPYLFAPEEQKHIPFFMWLSNDFKTEFNIDTQCLKNKINQELSHDNIFHSILGLFNIETKYYNKELDIFNNCRLWK